MGHGSNDLCHNEKENKEKIFCWEDIQKHTTRESKWIVIANQVYDVTRWALKHPGGSQVLGHYSGQDGTEPVNAFHKNFKLLEKYMKPLHLGSVASSDPQRKQNMKKDFEELRIKAHELGFFDSNPLFFTLYLIHIVVLEVLAYLSMKYFGSGWLPYIASVCLYATGQSQASWIQHDYGHHSVFKSRRCNYWAHQFTMSFYKGASAHWWNHMHYRHHSKPNVMNKDPDVRLQPLFVVGDVMPLEVAKKSISTFPYNLQQHYFFAILPPLLFPIFFQITTFRHALLRRCYLDLALMTLFFLKLFVLYVPFLGFGGTLLYYFIVRMVESHWFTWVSQSNHIPMKVDYDQELPWLEQQIQATCDVEQSWFNDWFTGHLNFQIEHHLFPTMPRHNYAKVQPLVQQLCKKYEIPYQVKPLMTAFCDIVRSLRHSGELWYAAYHAHHME